MNRIIRRGTDFRVILTRVHHVPLGVAPYTLPRATTYDDRIATRAAHIAPEYKGGDRKGLGAI